MENNSQDMNPEQSKPSVSWIFKMAIRESRGSRKRLLLFLSSIIMGVAALVAIQSFGDNLDHAIDQQARQLLGSDLVFEAREPFNEKVESLIDSIGGLQARDIEFNSMALFPSTGATRLSRIRAVEKNWPFYGSITTEPAEAAFDYHEGYQAILDRNLRIQFDLAVGDSVQIGNRNFRIAGFITDVPGESAAAGIIGPRIFIPYDKIQETGLLQRGSRVDYRVHFNLGNETQAAIIAENLENTLDQNRVSAETVDDRKASFGQAFGNMNQFLSMVAFIALLLGGIGVASAVFAYIKQRIATVAVLHCLGAHSEQTTAIYLVQMILVGIIGAIGGSALGVGIQTLIPIMLADFIPVDVSFFISLPAILIGFGVGIGTAILFALLPLAGIRNISPLNTLRSANDGGTFTLDKARIIIFSTIFVAITLFAISQTERWFEGLFFSLGIVAAILILTGIAKLLMISIRKYFPSGLSYVWRQGLANLYRPNNQTLILLLTIGFSTFLIATLYFTQSIILSQFDVTRQDNEANLVFFDIQTDQQEPLKQLLTEKGAPIIQDVPIVTMRMTHINNQSVESLRESGERTIPGWLYRQEVRATYRDSLTGGEKILTGEWVSNASFDDDLIPISVEESIAERMSLTVGDTIHYNVQGIPILAQVASTREVNWQQVQPNFIFVFPAGVLEQAPQFFVISTKADNENHSVELQSAVVSNFSNVSAIDLEVIISTVDDILGKITYVIQFMALFSVITGLIVLIGAVITSKFQRAKESVLLKTIGASKNQVQTIMFAEYLFLGIFSALTGLILAWLAAFLLALFVFDIGFAFALWPSVWIFVVVVVLTLGIGLINSRGLYRQPAIAVLREA